MMKKLILLLVVGAAGVGIGLLVAGGDGDDPAQADDPAQVLATRFVGEPDIREYPASSPERALLGWWRDIQFQNDKGALARYAPGVDLDAEELGRQARTAASSFAGIPEVVDVQLTGKLATVYLTIQPPGSGTQPRPLSMNLVLKDDGWLIRDNGLMTQQVNRVIAAVQRASE